MRNLRFATSALVAVLIVALLVVACASGQAPSATPAATSAPAKATAPSASAPQSDSKPSAPKESYKIGWVGSQTGAFGVYGDPALKAAQLAVEAVNKKGGVDGHPIELVAYDDESKPDRGLEVTKRLVDNDKPIAVAGYVSYLIAASGAPVLQEAKIPTEVLSGGYAVDPKKENCVFVISFPNGEQINAASAYLKKKGLTKVGLLLSNDALGELAKSDVQKAGPKYGLTVVGEERYNVADKDVTAQLSKLKAAGAQAVFGWGTGAPATLIAKNAVQVNLGGPLIPTAGNVSAPWAKTVADLPAGAVILPSLKITVISQVSDSDPSKAKMKEFYDAWKAKYQTDPGWLDSEGWATVNMFADAIAKVGPDRDKIRDYLENLKNYPSVLGMINRSPTDHIGITGDDNAVMVKVVDGKFAVAE